jgi:hypothetical protein
MIYFFVLAITFLVFINLTYSQAQNASKIKYKGESLTKEDVLKAVSNGLSPKQLKTIEPFIAQSFQGINQKNKTLTVEGIKNFKDFVTSITRDNADNKWQDCGTYCDPKPFYEYGFCYWKCIANGGPSKIATKNVNGKNTN